MNYRTVPFKNRMKYTIHPRKIIKSLKPLAMSLVNHISHVQKVDNLTILACPLPIKLTATK